jgi:hypothetical protein
MVAPNLYSVQPKKILIYMQDTRKINHMSKYSQKFMINCLWGKRREFLDEKEADLRIKWEKIFKLTQVASSFDLHVRSSF